MGLSQHHNALDSLLNFIIVHYLGFALFLMTAPDFEVFLSTEWNKHNSIGQVLDQSDRLSMDSQSDVDLLKLAYMNQDHTTFSQT